MNKRQEDKKQASILVEKMREIPYGVQDYLPEECFNKYSLEQRLSSFFYCNGFERIFPPAIEYLDTFVGADTNKLFKMSDSDGRILALRNDPTIQISRIAPRLKDFDRLYYILDSYEFISAPNSARTREFAQAGVELIGGSDLDAVVLAIDALRICGFEDFTIDIGDVSYFYGITDSLNLSKSAIAKLVHLINKKDATGIAEFLSQNGCEDGGELTDLVTLFGKGCLDRAAAKNQKSRDTISRLCDLYSKLCALGLDAYISLDLGLLPSGYYTGLVLHGYVAGLGLTVLNGGRYDGLINATGDSSVPKDKTLAVGWSIGIKRILSALETQGKLMPIPKIDYAYITDDASIAFSKDYVDKLIAEGKRVVRVDDFCKAKGAKAFLRFSDNSVEFVQNSSKKEVPSC